MLRPLAIYLALTCCGASAGDWTTWGGDAARNMVSHESGIPATLDPGRRNPLTGQIDLSEAQNVKWVTRLGAHTFGTPVIAHGKIFIGTTNDAPRNPKIQGERGVLMCFEEASGKFLWQLTVLKLSSAINDCPSLGISATPTVDGERVYVVTNRCEVLCLTVNGLKDGNTGPFKDEGAYMTAPGKSAYKPGPEDADIVWRFDMQRRVNVFPHEACDSSVLMIGDLLYVGTGNGVDGTHKTVAHPHAPSLVVLDKNGELVATDDAKIGENVFHGQWSSPSAGTLGGKTCVFYGGGDGCCYAFDATPVADASGRKVLHKIWSYDGNPAERRAISYPAAIGPSEFIATPVFYQDRIYIAVGQDPWHRQGLGLLHAIDATLSGDITKLGCVWSYDGIKRSLSTVAIADGLLYAADYGGNIHCLDAETGRCWWTHKMDADIWSSPLICDGKVYVGDDKGHLIILAHGKEKKILCEAHFSAPIAATPVAANGVLYIATQTHLFAFEQKRQ